MKERPILFTAAMAQATLAERKSQTRRIVTPKPQWNSEGGGWYPPNQHSQSADDQPKRARHYANSNHVQKGFAADFCPYGVPGDRLWGKETFFAWGHWVTQFNPKKKRDEWHFRDMTLKTGRAFLFDQPDGYEKGGRGDVTPQWWKRPAIFMPRIAARIIREITSIHVEPVQAISEADAIAEGLIQWSDPPRMPDTYYGITRADVWETDPRKTYARLWDEINNTRAPWESNPFVWVIKYKPLETAKEPAP